jgi:hypothetical protein
VIVVGEILGLAVRIPLYFPPRLFTRVPFSFERPRESRLFLLSLSLSLSLSPSCRRYAFCDGSWTGDYRETDRARFVRTITSTISETESIKTVERVARIKWPILIAATFRDLAFPFAACAYSRR